MCDPAHDCPICAPAAAIWAAAQAAANEPGTWTDADEAMSPIDPDPDTWASDADMDRAADYHYRNETSPSWDYGRTSA